MATTAAVTIPINVNGDIAFGDSGGGEGVAGSVAVAVGDEVGADVG